MRVGLDARQLRLFWVASRNTSQIDKMANEKVELGFFGGDGSSAMIQEHLVMDCEWTSGGL